jgi:hypothetical protein
MVNESRTKVPTLNSIVISTVIQTSALTIAVIQNRTYIAIITVQFRPAYTSVVSEVEIQKNQNWLRNIFVLCLY